ncbi:hypothetical protein GUITHDRAFT_143924 [Guillardia theta CCMP2712]|uniref:Condensation domain-containing protein n=1 Tax=Guillardia theta (strain CCMP2712) TaxID=905079 RepID=L1ISP8_GUITC|nr:hypothetical protein GUITHDRAFT_143924 [Guillardia theta CCMP2712]EKX38929.1 hypothetical protein GUITHDRAFT_143924 [Guillardia theta CCMP2712]|mmetsp:Transcript_7918/g.26489  ORF Transcript_7918/g.26489 Transcript_7918/m.26489 type:complete len:469 (-) Transcript_7918:552-1958(-)|eukprot:XP_005825909.1 hypothetical protein GUITHDRAFT_143924 [Guillardia theta CCMP2712]
MCENFEDLKSVLNKLDKEQILAVLEQALKQQGDDTQLFHAIRRAALVLCQQQAVAQGGTSAVSKSCLSYLARQDFPSSFSFLPCSEDDCYFLDHPHKPQFLLLKFRSVLDPSLLCSSLYSTMQLFPKASSRVVRHEDGRKFQLGVERSSLTAVKVSEDIMDDLSTLPWVVSTVQRSVYQTSSVPLLQSYLLRSQASSQGSSLLVGFHHVLGDGMSYASFISSWSMFYQQAVERRAAPVEEDQAVLDLEGCLSYPGPSPGFSPRILQFTFQRSELEERRSCIQQGDCHVSINDVLLAECACALAGTRCAGQVMTRVVVLADMRGRSLEEKAWGNHVVDFHLLLPVADLMEDDVRAVARRIRSCVDAQTAELKVSRKLLEERNRERAQVPKLLCWNSWAKAGNLFLSSHFGAPAGLADFRWMNSMSVEDSSVAMVLPLVDPPSAIAVQLCLDDPNEIESLARRWGTGVML